MKAAWKAMAEEQVARVRSSEMSTPSMRYFANPAHKLETAEAGPPRWRPDKTPCPEGMTLRERTRLLQDSIAENPDGPASRRFAVRRAESGLELFAAQVTQVVNGEIEYHGYPTHWVPGRILRQFRDQGKISDAEYRRLVKRLG